MGELQSPASHDGLACLYSAVSVRLAALNLERDEGDGSFDSHTHWTWACTSERDALIDRLAGKCRALTHAAPTTGTLGSVPVLSWFNALALDGPDPAGPEPGLEQALHRCVHWLADAGKARGTGAFELWFTDESVRLAGLGGYTNPARDDVRPHGHLRWSAQNRVSVVIRDLLDKTQEQYQRQSGRGPDACARFAADVLSRATAWGQIPGGLHHRVPDACPERWRQWATQALAEKGDQPLWRQVDAGLRSTALFLIRCGRAPALVSVVAGA